MKTGDTLIDRENRTWVLDQPLGRGTWGQSWIVRDGHDRELVLKVAHGAGDFAPDAPVPEGAVQACHAALEAQARLLAAAELPFLPRLESQFRMPDGRPALLMPRYGSSLRHRMETGLTLTATLRLVGRVARALADSGCIHGALRPSNVLLNDRGDPVLVDFVTPAVARWHDRLERLAVDRTRFLPPEAASGPPAAGWDTWAICQILYTVASAEGARPSERDGAPRRIRASRAPTEGLDKVTVAALKDQAMARLGGERTNVRFRGRLAAQLGALLNRGLARQAEPSPPYRFATTAPLADRLKELLGLVAPGVEDAGRVLLSGDAVDSVFQGVEAVAFSVSVGCSSSVTDHSDVVCGLQLLDIDAGGERVPIPDASFKVGRHPSGRLRFQFVLPGVPPGRYSVRAAFSIKDSGDQPQVAIGEFEVRPPAGYVPPAAEVPPPSTLRFPEPPPAICPPAIPSDADHLFDLGSDPGSDVSDPGAEVIEGRFPRPIAPPAPVEPAPPTVEASARSAAVAATGGATAPTEPVTTSPQPSGAVVPTLSLTPMAFAPSEPAPVARVPAAPPPPPIAAPAPTLGTPRAAARRPAVATPALDPEPVLGALDGADDIEADWWGSPGGGALDFGIDHDGLPTDLGEDLPTWQRRAAGFELGAIPGLDRVVELIARDSYTAFVGAVAASFIVLLASMALLRAC